MATVNGIDVSHWQGSIDWPKVRAAGYQFAVLKATESTNYVDPGFAVNRAGARAAGMMVGCYHFARAGDPAAEANAFLACIGQLAADEFAVLDWEVSPAGVDAVSWCAAFCDAVKASTGRLPLVYLNGPRIARDDWSPLVGMGVQLWLAGDGVNARYDGDPKPVTVNWWGAAAMKQFSETGTVPGIGGGVDLNVFYGDLSALAALGGDQEDDMYGPDQRYEVVSALTEITGNTRSTNSTVAGMAVQLAQVAAAVKQQPVDVGALAASIVPVLVPAIVDALGAKAGLTEADVEDAIRKVLGGLDGVSAGS